MTKISHLGRGKSAPAMRHKLLGSAASVVLAAITLTMAAAQPTMAADLTAAAKPYQIAPGPLQNVLAAYASANQLAISVDPALVANKQSPGLVGSYSRQQGLEQILQGTGLGLRATGSNAYSIYVLGASASATAASTTLKAVEVKAQSPEEAQKQAVYRKSVSTIYMDDTNFTKLKGSNVADIFRGQVGVYSGDARNSDTLDPNIRGLQGQGRVPVTIDGTEQSITKSKGFYTGTSNANYIDPNLIADGSVVKGAAISRDVQTSSGGGIALRTIAARDILKPGQSFGMRIKVDGESNTTGPRFPKTIPSGMVYNTDDYGSWDIEDGLKSQYPGTMVVHDQPTLFNSRSYSALAALAWQNEKLNFLAAYSYRQRGNYFAGRHGADKYITPVYSTSEEYTSITPVAQYYKSGAEVANTSNQAESLLLKGEWNIAEDMMLGFGARHTTMHVGAINPGILKWIQMSSAAAGEVFQWPENSSQQNAYNLDYIWVPESSRLVDLRAKLWSTQTNSLEFSQSPFDAVILKPVIYDQVYVTDPANKLKIQNNRTGFSISNKLQLHKTLSLLIGGDYQHESLSSTADWSSDIRAGQRYENDIYFAFNWQPLEWVEFDVGARRRAYSIKDEGYLQYLAANQSERDIRDKPLVALVGTADFKNLTGQSNYDLIQQAQTNQTLGYTDDGNLSKSWTPAELAVELQRLQGTDKILVWQIPLDKDGKIIGNPQRVTQERLDSAFGVGAVRIGDISLQSVHQGAGTRLLDANRAPPDGKSEASGWAPSLGVTFKAFHSRLYWRYAQDIRMPSMAEGTHGGYIALLHNRDYFGFNPLKPERSRNLEIGISHDFSRFFKLGTLADIKLAWFSQTTKDVIDTVSVYQGNASANLDRQTIKGVELQSRFDNGSFFAEFGAARTLENQICDRTQAIRNSSYFGEIPDCVNYGFPFGILVHAKQPKRSLSFLLGSRFFGGKLEMGARITHFSDYDRDAKISRLQQDLVGIPVNWDTATVVDAYTNYQINKKTMLEFSAMNLTNEYYVDPLSRSWMPAPGRTLRLGVRVDL